MAEIRKIDQLDSSVCSQTIRQSMLEYGLTEYIASEGCYYPVVSEMGEVVVIPDRGSKKSYLLPGLSGQKYECLDPYSSYERTCTVVVLSNGCVDIEPRISSYTKCVG